MKRLHSLNTMAGFWNLIPLAIVLALALASPVVMTNSDLVDIYVSNSGSSEAPVQQVWGGL